MNHGVAQVLNEKPKEKFFCFIMLGLLSCEARRGTFTEAIAGMLQDMEELRRGEPPDARVIRPQYDFVIVGAGTAGCLLANRLTEVKKFKVLLVEAGDREQSFMDVPVLATLLQFTDANWHYYTEPQIAKYTHSIKTLLPSTKYVFDQRDTSVSCRSTFGETELLVMEKAKSGCVGMKGGRCAWPRGRVVGGSSVLHSMMHTRGNRRDYDRWAAAGNPGK
ncbi:unnamed protein product [Plutella xylostella]|uniref:(diamondback moth) hypothetical protein n=1 Tax=Plutella xylostella TaxID=51655 RepID=A0A8S4DMR3_PLUXY|nr:unnamed protein product [Plutella xylostella]